MRVSNPDRVYFSTRGETKLDLVHYYLAVGDGIVRALRDRPCMMHRYPDGRGRRKDLPEAAAEGRSGVGADGRGPVPVRPLGQRIVRDRARERRVGGADVHGRVPSVALPPRRTPSIPTSCVSTSTRSPAPVWPRPSRSPPSYTRRLTSWAPSAGPRRRGRGAFTSTFGSSRHSGSGEVRRAALALAREVERRAPDLVTTAWWKEERTRAIFVDYNQNARDRTIASAYSVRGQAVGAGVGAGDLVGAAGRRDRGLHDRHHAGAVCRAMATCTLASTTRSGRSSRCWSGPIGMSGTAAWATRRIRRTSRRCRGSRRVSSRRRWSLLIGTNTATASTIDTRWRGEQSVRARSRSAQRPTTQGSAVPRRNSSSTEGRRPDSPRAMRESDRDRGDLGRSRASSVERRGRGRPLACMGRGFHYPRSTQAVLLLRIRDS